MTGHPDAPWLSAIAAHPGDPTPLLAYADALDERGDPEAVGLRVAARKQGRSRPWRPVTLTHHWSLRKPSPVFYRWYKYATPYYLWGRLTDYCADCSGTGDPYKSYVACEDAWAAFCAAWRQADADGAVPWQYRRRAVTT